MRLLSPLLLAVGILFPACKTTEVHRPFAQAREAAVVRTAPQSAGWNVLRNGELAGSAVLFSGEDDGTYVVRDAWGQDLGLIDSLGRAWRFAPHETEAEWVGTGSVQEGVAQILRQDAEALTLTPWRAPGTTRGPLLPASEIPSSREGSLLEEHITPDPHSPLGSTTTATSP